jgi:cytochrome c553
MKNLIALASLAALSLSVPALADDAADAQTKASTVCAACHGPDGNSFNPEWPKLAGQQAGYTAAQLKAFRCAATGKPDKCVARAGGNAALMIGMAAALTDAEIDALAAFYAQQKVKPGQADAALLEAGERLYRGGRKTVAGSKIVAIPACIACHGPAGQGNGPGKFPALGGQHATYLAAQLQAYRARAMDPSGQAGRDGGQNRMMSDIAQHLTDDEIKAVSAYLQGLH